jgi:hypothetical protein
MIARILVTSVLLLYSCAVPQIDSERVVISGNDSGVIEQYINGEANILALRGFKENRSSHPGRIAVGYFLILDPGLMYSYHSSSLNSKDGIQSFWEINGLGEAGKKPYKYVKFEIKFNPSNQYFQIDGKSYNRKSGNLFLVILDKDWNSKITQINQFQEELIGLDQVLKLIQSELSDNKTIQNLKAKGQFRFKVQHFPKADGKDKSRDSDFDN